MNGVPHLELIDVSVRYGEVRALQQVSLRVPTGQIIALIGANGAGNPPRCVPSPACARWRRAKCA